MVDKLTEIDEFEDSSDDDEIVTTNPYSGISNCSKTSMRVVKTKERLSKIQTAGEILGKAAIAHQNLLNKPAVPGIKKKNATNRSASIFTAPLADVKEILDALPSKPKKQKDLKNTIVPSFRGFTWQKDISPLDLFFSTRVNWEDENVYSKAAYVHAKVDLDKHTRAKFAADQSNIDAYESYNLEVLKSLKPDQLEKNNTKLKNSALKLKQLFQLASAIDKPFVEWIALLPKIRKAKGLQTLDADGEVKTLTLADILSYYYVNDYKGFKAVLKNLAGLISTLSDKDPGVKALQAYYKELALTPDVLDQILFLSEAQIPRHAVLYAFGLKMYSAGTTIKAEPLYQKNARPQKNRIYLGKLLLSGNPHTLFSGKDRAVFIPDFDERLGGAIIGKSIIGEKEIQHQAANLEGTVKKGINVKLPKFHHAKAPAHYNTKYGMDDDLYQEFKTCFSFLNGKKEHGKLSWMYLETVLLSHLIHFHELQSFKYSNKMATDMGKEISWYSRDEKTITNPFKV